ncbi:hypothetical protein [Rhodanobacter sp. DHB23]|uniref:hypothetical protein n=1 Tax=Rhodanobacter sp. DHB23 TaxID=2775923 RepID=UPI00177AC5B3|nr:hypothetical protein [Rhodanobacter sp. DHB23]MBD8871828.1 hypothetical protein [Rhodanobacter sp. DHB23]
MSWIDKLKSSLGAKSAGTNSEPGEEKTATAEQPSDGGRGTGLYHPFDKSQTNFFYNLLFCDDIKLFAPGDTARSNEPWSNLLAEHPDSVALQSLAMDETQEGRVRALAYGRLRAAGALVPTKKTLAVIVEVQLQHGLDVLAVFAEGGVRYLNQSGKIAIFEGAGHPVEKLAHDMLKVAQPIVDRIGPWEKGRLPPPKKGNVRMTFLVSDGLYFGEGPLNLMQSDPMAGPLIGKATQLLQAIVELGVNSTSGEL